MEQEYTISKGTKVFYSILAIGLFLFSILLFNIYNPSAGAVVLMIPIFLLVGSILIIINIFRKAVITSSDSIILINLLYTKELNITAVKGYRLSEKTIYIEPFSTTDSKIVIQNYIDLKSNEELEKWVRDHFVDLDAIDLEQHQNTILHSQGSGLTEAQRDKTFKKAKEIALAYNIWSSFLGFIMIFFNNLFSTCLLLIAPLVGISILITSKGLTKFLSNSRRSVCNYIVIGFGVPSITLLIKSTGDYNLASFNLLCLQASFTSAGIFILTFSYGINRSAGGVTAQTIFIIVVSLIYGFGSIRQANCFFDTSRAQAFNAVVLAEEIRHSKSTNYYLTLSAWGPRQEAEPVEVSKSIYITTQPGDTVKVNLRKGLLHIPWFSVSR